MSIDIYQLINDMTESQLDALVDRIDERRLLMKLQKEAKQILEGENG